MMNLELLLSIRARRRSHRSDGCPHVGHPHHRNHNPHREN